MKEAKEFNQLVKKNIIDETEPHTRLVHVYDLYSIEGSFLASSLSLELSNET